ncbi:MAG: hypothetical protein IJD58_04665 [Lachnospiraceae bacterium]|nr:hypothetical protein [Lachnospiraceae bacterium]
MNLRLKFYLYRSFLRERRALITFICLSIISTFVIMSYAYMINVIEDMNRQQFEKDCGKMDVHIVYNEDFIRDRVLTQENIKSYYEYYAQSKYIEETDNYYEIVYCDEPFFQYSSYQTIEGKFPDNEEEIMCEPWFLRSMGIKSENMIGSSVEVEGKKYIVSGLIVDKTYGEIDINVALFVKKIVSDKKCNSIMIDLGCDVTDEIRAEFYEDTLDAEKYSSVGINVDKQMALKNVKESTQVAFIFVFLVLLISIIIILYNYILLFMNKIKDSINNYLQVGLSKYVVMSSISRAICTVIIISNFVGGVCYYFFSKQMCNKIVFKNQHNYRYVVTDVSSKKMLIFFLCFCFFEVLLVSIKMYIIFYGKKYFKNGRFGKVYSVNPKSYNEKKPYLTMAKNNLRMSRSNSILTVVAVAVIICAYITSIYYVKIIDRAMIDYDNVKYILKLPDDYTLDEPQVKEKSKLINDMIEDERFGAFVRNVYYTKSNIDINRISDKCENYLELYYEYSAMLGNGLTENIPISIALMSSEQLEDELDIQLERNQGVFFSTSTCYQIKDAINMSVGEYIDVFNSEYEKKQIEIVNIEKDKCFNIYSDSMSWVLVVNNETFNMLSGGITPNRIYLSKDISEGLLLEYLRDVNYIQIERIDFDNQTISTSYSETEILLFLILAICTSVLFVSLTVSCNTRIKVFSTEYKTLFSIGLPIKKVIRVPIYEMSIILLEIIVISFAGSFIVTKIAYQLSVVKIIYVFPIMEWIKTMIIVVIFVTICLLYNVREIMKIEKK